MEGLVNTVAALYVQRDGVYFGLDGVDPWDEDRDARTYNGPNPVVAHPPCNRWVNFAHLNYARYGGEHNRPGNDGGCFLAGLRAVGRFGGVLEHPAFSHAWKHYGLLRPEPGQWTWDGQFWVAEVWQSAYGHKARKRTWLAYYGTTAPTDLDWSREPGTHQCGWFDRIKPTLGKKAAQATPLAFALALVDLARRSICDEFA